MMETEDGTSTNSSPVPATFGTKDYVDEAGKRVILKTPSRQFICCICDKSFNKKMPCLKHMIVTHKIEVKEIKMKLGSQDSFPLKCAFCGKKFTQRNNLYRHLRVVHEGKGLPTSVVEKIESTVRVHCPVCVQVFTSIPGVNRHIRRYHSETSVDQTTSDLVACHFCGMKFADQSKHVSHMSSYHYAIVSSKSNEEDGTMEMSYQCSLCDTTTNLKSRFEEHVLNEHEKDVNEFCVQVTSESEEEADFDEIYYCNSCHKSFETEESWRSHMRDEHKAFPDSCCWKCGDHSSKTVYELKCHMKDVHSFTVPEGNEKRAALRAGNCLGLKASEFRALERIPEWLVKHGGGQLLLVLNRKT